MSEALSCRGLVEVVTDYPEGAMSASDRARFEAHLGDRSGCAGYFERMRQTIDVVGEVREEALDPHTRDRLLTALRGWAGGR